MLTYVANSLFIVYLPLWGALRRAGWVPSPPRHDSTSRRSCLEQVLRGTEFQPGCCGGQPPLAEVGEGGDEADDVKQPDSPVPHSVLAHTALVMAPLWIAANGSYNYSLSYTTVASSTILSATSSLFAFGFAVLARVEQFEWVKLVGVVNIICARFHLTYLIHLLDLAGVATLLYRSIVLPGRCCAF